jgi:hypothetical protein
LRSYGSASQYQTYLASSEGCRAEARRAQAGLHQRQ